MKPIIPYEFDPPAADYETAHLVYQDVAGGQMVSWPVVGASLLLPKSEHSVKIQDIETHNKGKFKAHGRSGFSVGDYHEFLVGAWTEKICGFKMGNIEATFGEATPLAAMIFAPYHRGKYHSEWNDILSLRIIGIGVDEVEAAFLSACSAYEAKFGELPTLYPLQDLSFEDEFDDVDEPEIIVIPQIVMNIEPLRFFYNGLSQVDDAAACIYFYRVLEYFSFLTNANEMKKLRHDDKLSDVEFSKRILDLVSRDEKGPIFKLITTLIDSAMLATAVSDGLIAKNEATILCEGLYGFRNSIVHGKFSYGYALQSGSVLDEDPQLPRWKTLLRSLARRALDRYGSKKT